MKALFSGSFDPITLGHTDIIRRCAALFDEVYVAAFENPNKTPTFSLDTRKELIEAATADLKNVKVFTSHGTVADFVKEHKINVIVKGVRSPLDCQYETEMADANRKLCGAETLMLACDAKFSRVSSSLVRELLRLGKDISDAVPASVYEKIRDMR